MRPATLVTAMLAVTAVALGTGPPAAAHTCTGQDYLTSCGPCVEGEDHSHADTRATAGSCVTKKPMPGLEPVVVLGVLGLLAAARRRR